MTYFIAQAGLKMTIISFGGVFIYIFSFIPNSIVFRLCVLVVRVVPVAIGYLWITLKVKLDAESDRERVASSNMLNKTSKTRDQEQLAK